MRLTTALLFGTLLACLCWNALACEQSEMWNGCKISAGICSCGFGCQTEFIYRSRQACNNALRERRFAETERSSNACKRVRAPCGRGICTQTAVAPGFSCKCDGTGFYGRFCEKACPTGRVYGQVTPHECIVI